MFNRLDVRNSPQSERTSDDVNSPDKPTVGYRTNVLVALLGVSVGLNVFLALRAYRPQLWNEIRLAMIRPPVARSDDHIRGRSDAQVIVIEYSDFQCPFSAQIHAPLGKLAEEGKIRWVFRNYPLLSIHPKALEAAEAAECAGEQGRFWEYTDALFEAQSGLRAEDSARDFLAGLASRVGLDDQEFRRCLSARRYEGRVRSQLAEGNAELIAATPTIFVNGRRQVGSVTFDQLKQMVLNAGN